MATLTPTRKSGLRRELETIVGSGGVLSEPDELLVYESDGLTLFRALADFIVFPSSAEQVAGVVRLANREGIPFVARGAGTGLAGGCLAAEGGLVISMMRMNRVLEIDYDNQIAVVEPGLVNLHLSWAVGARGFLYAPDPSSQQACTIGGNVATNSGGPHTLKYGVTVDHVIGVRMVLPDGTIVDRQGGPPDAPGYDLAGGVLGREGSFGIATEITVKLIRKARSVRTLLGIFDSIEGATRTVSDIIAGGMIPAAVELMDNPILAALNKAFGMDFPEDAAAVVLIEIDGLSPSL